MKILDMFCGAGGAARGLQQAGFYVIGVDHRPQPHYCGDEFYCTDAMTFPLEGFDAYWASPPCQGYSVMRHLPWLKDKVYPLLIEPVRERLKATGKPYIIENVKGAPLEDANYLCGLMFGLHVFRHRYFETSFPWLAPGHPSHKGLYVRPTGSRGGRARDMVVKQRGSLNFPLVTAREAMGIDWMTRDELSQSIPPAYSQYLGEALMRTLVVEAARGRED